MLVSLGAALFVLIPLQTGVSPEDMTRVLQGLIAGIGFLQLAAWQASVDASSRSSRCSKCGGSMTGGDDKYGARCRRCGEYK
jgi:hypothetical protein